MLRFGSWPELVTAFRALGGVADNIVQRDGPLGRGLFPLDPSLPVRLHVPQSLLVPEADIEMRDGDLCVRESAAIPEPVREFFDAYQRFASWGGGGRQEVVEFLTGVAMLPHSVASALKSELHLDFLFEDATPDAIRERFVKSRYISSGGRLVIMPMAELANHSSDGVPFDTSAGVTIAGYFDGEILVRYDFADTCLRFIHYGFVAPERYAFSVPMSIRQGGATLTVEQAYHANRVQGDVLIPLTSNSGSELALSHLTLGDRKKPYSPRFIFQQVARPIADAAGAQELFDRILMVNRTLFLKLLAACEDADGPMVSSIRRVCRLQLESLTSCLIRRPDPRTEPPAQGIARAPTARGRS